MRGVLSNANDNDLFLILPPEPPLQASSSPIPRIQIWSAGDYDIDFIIMVSERKKLKKWEKIKAF